MGKPMIISTGGAELDDVRRAYDTIMPMNTQLAILQYGGLPGGVRRAGPAGHRHLPREFPDAVVGSPATTTGSRCRWPPTCWARGWWRSTSR